ncbi:MAG: hypothetical protein ACO1RT_19805 [Planctomycetaceae bacterium]
MPNFPQTLVYRNISRVSYQDPKHHLAMFASLGHPDFSDGCKLSPSFQTHLRILRMKRISAMLLCLAAILLVSPSFAEDAPAKKGKGKGKGKSQSAAMMEKLSAAELTAEQKTKIEALGKELDTTMATLREEGFTPALAKQKADAMKKAREEGKRGKNVEADVLASLNLTEEQKAVLKKAADAQVKFNKGVANELTDEQIAKLPQALQQQLNRAKGAAGAGGGKGKGKGKGKKANADA